MATSGISSISAGESSKTVTHTYGDDDFTVMYNFGRDVGSVWITGKSATEFTINITNVDIENTTSFTWAIAVGAQEVTTPSTNYYAVLANAIEHSGVSYNQLGLDSQSDYEDLATRLILKASRLIDRYCDVPDAFFYGGSTITEYKDGKAYGGVDAYQHTRRSQEYDDWRRTYVLDYTPVVSVTSVSENTVSVGSTPSWSAITAYTLNSTSGRIVFAQAIEPDEGVDNIRVIYVAGYASLPSAIEMACEELVGNTLKAMVKNLLNAQYRFGGKAQPIEVQPAIDLTASVKQMLLPYKRLKM